MGPDTRPIASKERPKIECGLEGPFPLQGSCGVIESGEKDGARATRAVTFKAVITY
jgi:hypothetical protein